MFSEIENALINTLQESLEAVPKENISTKRPDLSVSKNLPAISIVNVDFDIGEVGVGRSVNTADKENGEFFSGNGQNDSFTLSKKPLRPILSVEHPPGRRREENVDYTVDYEKGVITFRSPPEKGSDNVMIKYLIPLETKGIKVNLRYQISVWSKDEVQRDKIAVDVIKTLLREEEAFDSRGFSIKPLKGFNPPLDEAPKGVYGKTIECLAEAYLQVEIPLPRIEKIEIKEKKA